MIATDSISIGSIVLSNEICGPSNALRKKYGSQIESIERLKDFEEEKIRASPVSVTAVLDREQALKKISQIPYYDDDSEIHEPNSSPKLSKRNQKKKVRFLLDEDGNIEEGLSLYSFPDFKLTPKMIQECWYSKEDRLRSKFQIHKFCREFATSLEDHQAYFDAMSTAISFLAHSDDEHEDSTYLTDDALQAMTFLVSGETRGMERSMQFHMSLPRISTKTNVQAVLRTQTLLRELGSDKYDLDEVEELIADQCIMNSQLGVRWAKMVAQGDAVDAWLHLVSS